MRRNFENWFESLILVCGSLLLWPGGTCAQSNTAMALVEFTHARYTVRPNGSTASITLRRTGATNTAVAVEFATADDSAEAGIDYAAKKGPINFAPGQAAETIGVMVLTSTRRTSPETVRLALSNPTGGAVLGPRSTAELVLPRIWKAGWLNFGLDHIVLPWR